VFICYIDHSSNGPQAAATTLETSASQARIFDSNERSILNKSVIKSGAQGWNGVLSHSSDTRTCDLELPRGHATVKCGKYFEVRYFLNVIASTSHSKSITCQLPIVLIHMNSLDVVPNSVAQVAAAIEEKRAKKHQRNRSRQPAQLDQNAQPRASEKAFDSSPSQLARRPSTSASVQGRAFAAPRKQSLDRLRAEAEELNGIGKLLYKSPRKYVHSDQNRVITSKHTQQIFDSETYDYHTPPSNRRALVLSDELGSDIADVRARLRRMRSNETNRSINVSTCHKEVGTSAPRRGNSARSLGGTSARVGFRELEVGIEIQAEAPAPVNSRFESLNAANTRESQSKKPKSGERWKGPSWFSDRKYSRGRERSREQSRERYYNEYENQEKQEVVANWV
jgi:hypothetical protein